MGVEQTNPIPLFCDNKSTIFIAKHPSMHGRTKHIDIRYDFIRNLQNEGVICLNYCNTSEQLADIFTKGLTIQKYENLRSLLGLRSFEARSVLTMLRSFLVNHQADIEGEVTMLIQRRSQAAMDGQTAQQLKALL